MFFDTFTLVLFVLVALLAGIGAGFGAGWHLRAEHDRPPTRFEPAPPPTSTIPMPIVRKGGPDRHPEADALVGAIKLTPEQLADLRAGRMTDAVVTYLAPQPNPAVEACGDESLARRNERIRLDALKGPREAREFTRR